MRVLLVALAGAVVAQAEECYRRGRYEQGRFQRASLRVQERERHLLLYIPRGLPEAGRRAPAALAFHGFHSNPWYFGRLVDITAYAERYNHVVALPFGTSPTAPSEICCPFGCDEACCSKGDQLDSIRPCMWNEGKMTANLPRVRDTDDVAMARAAVDFLVENLCVDRERVSALGFSLGGNMMHRMACEASDVFNGVAAISGSMDIDEERCRPSKPLSWVHYCGTADKGCTATVNSTFALFAERMGCQGRPLPTYVSATTRCEAFSKCREGTFVERCLLLGLGDDVPGHQRQVPVFVAQPATNLDAIKYSFDRFSTQVREPSFEDHSQAGALLQV